MITVAVADAHYLVREGVRRIVAQCPGLQWVGEARNSAELRDLLRTTKPQVLIFDFDLQLHLSLDDLLWVPQFSETTKVLVISAEQSVAKVSRVMNHGICSYLLKECEADEVTDAIYATAKGERFFCNKVLDILLSRSSSGTDAQKCLPTSLSRRELEIVERICKGHTANEIANRLHLSVHTVNTHRKNIFKKMGVRSNAELVFQAMQTSMV